jgi:hypothetical protein
MSNHTPSNHHIHSGVPASAGTGLQSGPGAGLVPTTGGLVSRYAINIGGLGAIVGGTAAAAQLIPKVRKNEMTAGEATRGVVKEAAGTGLATAAGAAMAGAVGLGGLVSLLAMFGVATGVKYLWNAALEGEASGSEAEAPAKKGPAPATAKTKKTSKT